ncbi:hypothetical protein PRIPAC_76822, partial [Pristionchus pacificus]|uniref:Uncharacterized protein n=1 Tax=Pristionchus pacificus TaxID=54126 RepID=A0A2A6BWC5_PRIPA
KIALQLLTGLSHVNKRRLILSGRLYSRVVLDNEVLSADHSIGLEPLATEHLSRSLRGVGPLDGDTVVGGVLKKNIEIDTLNNVPHLLSEVECITRDSDDHAFLLIESTVARVHSESLHIIGLESPTDASSSSGALKTILLPGWVKISAGGADAGEVMLRTF